MLRISRDTTTSQTDQAVVLRLEGQVSGPWVAELDRACQKAMGDQQSPKPLVLDLAGVLFIDADGIALFRVLAARRVSFINCSLFIAEQLKEVSNADG